MEMKRYNQLTQEQFIKKSKEVHGEKYDYSKTIYVNSKIPVIIICKKHGEFQQSPLKHYNVKQGCPICAGNIKKTKEEIVKNFERIHGKKYDYSLVNYINNKVKVKIICKEHGEFEQSPHNHLLGNGCPFCANNQKLTKEQFINKAKKIHGNIYDYSKVNYQGVNNKVVIICHKHGEFEQSVTNHIHNKNGCPKCKLSTGETKVMLFLEEHKIEYSPQKRFKQCKNKGMLPFDFYLPTKDVCIEFQGKQHYKMEKFFGGKEGFKLIKINDKIKKEFCKKNGIKLIRIKYNKNIKEILIKHLLN